MDINSYIRHMANVINESAQDELGIEKEAMSPAEIAAAWNDREKDYWDPETPLPGPSTPNSGVKSFQLDKVTVDGKEAKIKDLKTDYSSFFNGDEGDATPQDSEEEEKKSPEDDPDFDPEDEVETDTDKDDMDFSSAGAFSIGPDQVVKVSGSVKFNNGEIERVSDMEIQGPTNKGTIFNEL